MQLRVRHRAPSEVATRSKWRVLPPIERVNGIMRDHPRAADEADRLLADLLGFYGFRTSSRRGNRRAPTEVTLCQATSDGLTLCSMARGGLR